jgi:hypothetical protein
LLCCVMLLWKTFVFLFAVQFYIEKWKDVVRAWSSS